MSQSSKKSAMSKVSLSVRLTPRNPLVAAAKFRKAGSHRPSNKAVRAQLNRELRNSVAGVVQVDQLDRVLGEDDSSTRRAFVGHA